MEGSIEEAEEAAGSMAWPAQARTWSSECVAVPRSKAPVARLCVMCFVPSTRGCAECELPLCSTECAARHDDQACGKFHLF